ncbi:MAG: glycosyltransferase family A protein [Eubacteriales bacterium]
MPKVSVIVPAYNAEKYLRETLDCLEAQTLPDIEVIIVNDGSTDTTRVIIDEYCAGISDNIIFKSITQLNAGVSVARNTGLETAQGEYVLFLDSDDLLTAGSLEAFYSALKENNADVAIGRLQSFGATKETFNPFADKLANKVEIDMFDKELLWNFLVGNKCYNREKLINSGVRFPLLKYSEEGAFFMEFVLAGAKITGTPDACMKYRRHSAEEGLSVSQCVSLLLAKDFIASLTRIYTAAVKALETAPPQINREDYLQEIILKTDRILIAQFYRLFWRADQDCLNYIGEQHEILISKMTVKTVNEMKKENADLPSFVFDKKGLAEKPQVTVILGVCGGNDLNQTINSIFAQSMPAFELILPATLLEQGKIPEQWRGCENIKILTDENFWREAKKAAKSTRVLRIKKPFKLDERFFRFILK